jgi:hypothetical protein
VIKSLQCYGVHVMPLTVSAQKLDFEEITDFRTIRNLMFPLTALLILRAPCCLLDCRSVYGVLHKPRGKQE